MPKKEKKTDPHGKRTERKIFLNKNKMRDKVYLSVFCEEYLSKGKKCLLEADYKLHDGKLGERTCQA